MESTATQPYGAPANQIQDPNHPPPARRMIVSDGGPRAAPNRDPRGIVRRDVEPHDVAARLRGMLGLDPEAPAPGEQAAAFCELPSLTTELDAGGWIAWCLAGLPVFSGERLSLAKARDATVRTVLARLLLRVRGNISEAQRLSGTSRKVIRDNMKRTRLYPWHAALRGVMGLARPGQDGGGA